MPTAGVRPLAGRVIFAVRALLDQALTGPIEHENREGAVQQSVLMDLPFVAVAQRAVGFIHEDDLLELVRKAGRHAREP